MEREPRNPYQQRGGTSSAGAQRAPGKMSLTEALGSEGQSAVEPEPANAAAPADAETAGADAEANERQPAPVPQPQRTVPRLDLGKPKSPEALPSDRNVGGDGQPAANAGPNAAKGPERTAPDPPSTGSIKIDVQRTAAGNPNQARTAVGVGEAVTFTAKGDGEWTADGASIGSGESAAWTAPATPGSVVISHASKAGAAQKQTMKVVAPLGVEFASRGGFPVAPAGVGMTATVTVLPTNVSFGACEWLESPGGADAVSGYFAAYVKAGKGDLAHHPATKWLGMGDANNAIEDHAWTSDNPKLVNPDDNTLRHWAGAFGWNIPNKYRVNGGGDGQVFTTVRQQFTMADDGAVTVQKGAATKTQAGDGTVVGSMEKCTTVGQAHAMLNRQGSRTKMIMLVMQYNASADKDPETLRNLVAALKQEDIKFYVHIYCDNTYNYFSRDGLSLEVKGSLGSHKEDFLINSKKNREVTFSISEVLDFASMTPEQLVIRATNDDGKPAFSTTIGFPFEPISDVDAGSSGHYKISAHIQ